MSDPRPTIALYHHLPPGGADRAMYELVRRTADDIRYLLFEIEPGRRDPFRGAGRAPLAEAVAEHHSFSARSGGNALIGRWAVSVPSTVRAERRIAAAINARSDIDGLLVHHQRFLQAPTLLGNVQVPSVYFVHEPRRRSFEYDLRHPATGRSIASILARPVDALARRLDISNTRAADLLLCNSDNTREYIWRAYGRDATVVRLGVDTDHFRPSAEVERGDEVLAVGSLDPSKGHDLAIAALATMPPERRPPLRIVHNRTDEPTRAALVQQARDVGVELILESNVSEADLLERYQRARVVVITARVEPLGLSALEAVACGTPVVAVREGGVRETIVHEVTGLLSDRDPEAVGAAIDRVITRDFAPSSSDLAENTRERFGWEAGVDTYRAALLRVSDRRR